MAFVPFFSSRPAGRGRGLGLSQALRKIQANGGRMWIESASGAGAKWVRAERIATNAEAHSKVVTAIAATTRTLTSRGRAAPAAGG